jgi:serine-type D-Ala-D-Ala carboxypeptidase (penicillin-binding protein 5/6)
MRMIACMSRLYCVRVLALLITGALATSCGGNPPPSNRPSATAVVPQRAVPIPKTPPPPVKGDSVIVIDAISGQVLYAKNADAPRAVASTQKILTALCVLDAGDIDKPVVIQKIDTLCEPTKLDIKPGETYSRRDLLKVLMVKSANDVARALARDVAGDLDSFNVLMNQKAHSLGMRNSNFLNPNGLPAVGQYSTARDMAIAARAAYRSPLIRSITATKAFEFRFNNGSTRLLENTNKLLKTLDYCDGFKTGYTHAAGKCLVSSGSLNGRSSIVVILKSSSTYIWKDSAKLLSWALEPAAGS